MTKEYVKNLIRKEVNLAIAEERERIANAIKLVAAYEPAETRYPLFRLREEIMSLGLP